MFVFCKKPLFTKEISINNSSLDTYFDSLGLAGYIHESHARLIF